MSSYIWTAKDFLFFFLLKYSFFPRHEVCNCHITSLIKPYAYLQEVKSFVIIIAFQYILVNCINAVIILFLPVAIADCFQTILLN